MARRTHSDTRARIAAAAARLMAEDGIDDFALAKRKAAKQLGALDAQALPGNDEIEAELRAYLALYQAEEHPQRVGGKPQRAAVAGADAGEQMAGEFGSPENDVEELDALLAAEIAVAGMLHPVGLTHALAEKLADGFRTDFTQAPALLQLRISPQPPEASDNVVRRTEVYSVERRGARPFAQHDAATRALRRRRSRRHRNASHVFVTKPRLHQEDTLPDQATEPSFSSLHPLRERCASAISNSKPRSSRADFCSVIQLKTQEE